MQSLLAIALDDECLPEGAEKRCIERVAVETGPFRVVPRPAHLRLDATSAPSAPENQRDASDSVD